MDVEPLYEYKDYRDLLGDAYRRRKEANGHVSYRMMGRILGVDASFLVKVIRGEVHLGESALEGMVKFLKLDERGARFLQALFHYSRSRTPAEMKHHYEEMIRIRGVGVHSLEKAQYRFYEKWHHTAIWAMLHCVPDQSPGWYAQALRPELTVEQVEDSLALLGELGFLGVDEHGSRVLNARHLESGNPRVKPAVREFHRQMIGLAALALESVPAELRDISGITVSIDQECLDDVREIVKDARKRIQNRVDEVEVPDQVAQINFQVFPISRIVP